MDRSMTNKELEKRLRAIRKEGRKRVRHHSSIPLPTSLRLNFLYWLYMACPYGWTSIREKINNRWSAIYQQRL